MKKTARFITKSSALIAAGLSSMLFVKPDAILPAYFKILAQSMTPSLALLGGIGAGLGLMLGAPVTVAAGLFGAVTAANYIRRAIAPHDGFERAFGCDWQQRIPPTLTQRLQRQRWVCIPSQSPEPRWTRDLAFWTIPGTDRDLLCDIWLPPESVESSGLAFIYVHGSGWHFQDKDYGTRPFFRHLAAQGHVVMDVAYRLCPETDFHGMLGDVKRAIAWMKAEATTYHVDPGRIVIGGASAGAHLALVAAYAPEHPELTPADVQGTDLSVRGVVSYYGITDMRTYYEQGRTQHAANPIMKSTQSRAYQLADRLIQRFIDVDKYMLNLTHEDIMNNLLGGQLEEVPEVYDLASPITHVTADSPPTLLLYGEHDMAVSVEAARELYHTLHSAGVPVVYVEFPQTEHGFDVALGPVTQFSPAAQASRHDVERFLALLAG